MRPRKRIMDADAPHHLRRDWRRRVIRFQLIGKDDMSHMGLWGRFTSRSTNDPPSKHDCLRDKSINLSGDFTHYLAAKSASRQSKASERKAHMAANIRVASYPTQRCGECHSNAEMEKWLASSVASDRIETAKFIGIVRRERPHFRRSTRRRSAFSFGREGRFPSSEAISNNPELRGSGSWQWRSKRPEVAFHRT